MNLDRFIEETDKALLYEGNRPVLTRTVEHFTNREHLLDLIDTCLTDTLDAVVENSFLHPNGFDKLVLVSGEHFNLRLHNFHPPQEMIPAESVHNHKWEFATSMVHGSYTASNYDVTAGDESRWHYKYSKEYGLTYIGMQEVRPLDKTTFNAGDTYFMPGDRYHSIQTIGPEGCITVMMTGYTKEIETNVYSLTELDAEKAKTNCGLKMYSSTEVSETLKKIKGKI